MRPEEIANLQATASELASRLASLAAVVAGRTFDAAVALVFVVMTTYFVLRHWRAFKERAIACLPLQPNDTRELLEELRAVGKATLLGVVVTGLLEGLVAAGGYALLRVPEPAFFGAATFLSSFLPGIGTMLVWLPIRGYLFATGRPLAAVGELLAGSLLVGLADYVVRPWLVGAGRHVPVLLTFAALLGGLETFGLVGLFVGPILVSMALAILRIYERHRRTLVPPMAPP